MNALPRQHPHLAGGLACRVSLTPRGGQARRLNDSCDGCRTGLHRRYAPPGFTLLEVILALAILAGAIAVVGEVSSLGLRNAQKARDLTHAQLLCESKLAEIVAGLEPLEAQEGTPLGTVEDGSEPDWLYSVEVNPTPDTGLVEVRVTVSKDLPAEQRPASFTLVRWMLDPEATATETDTAEMSDSAESSGGDNP